MAHLTRQVRWADGGQVARRRARPRPVEWRRRRGDRAVRRPGRRRAQGGTPGRESGDATSGRRWPVQASRSPCTTPTSAAPCWTRSTRTTASGSSTWPRRPTSWWTAAFTVRPPRSGRRVRSWPTATRTWWCCRSPTSARRVRGRRGGRPIRCLYAMSRVAVAVRSHHRHPRVAAGRYRLGHRRRSGGVGRAGRVLQPIALRHRRLHRLLPVRRRRHGARPGVRRARPGRRRHPPHRAVAGTPEKPGRLPDLSVQGRLRPAVRDGAAAVARPAALAGGAGGIPGPQVRRDRRAVRGLAADRRAGRRRCSPGRR